MRGYAVVILVGFFLGLGGSCSSSFLNAQHFPIPLSQLDVSNEEDRCKALLEQVGKANIDSLNGLELDAVLRHVDSLLLTGQLSIREETTANTVGAYTLTKGQKLESAFPYLKRADELAEQLPPKDPIKGFAHGSYGVYLLYYQAPEQAIQPLKKAIHSFEEASTGEGRSQGALLRFLINAYLAVNQVDSVKTYLHKLTDFSRQFDDVQNTTNYCNNVGLGLAKLGYHEDALRVFQQGLDIISLNVPEQELTYVNTTESMAHSLAVKGRYTEAMQNLYQAYEVRKRCKRYFPSLRSMGYIIKYLMDQGRYMEALRFFEKENDFFQKHKKLNEHSYQLFAELERLFLFFGKKQEANTYKILYNQYLAEVILPREKSKKPNSALNSFFHLRNESYLQEQRIAVLEKEQLQQELYSRKLSIVGLVILLTLLGVGAFFYRKVSKERADEKLSVAERHQALLIERNEKLSELQAFKQRMTSMIVHDLKTPLQVIFNRSDPDYEGDKAIHSASRRMLLMVQNLLDVDKAEQTELMLSLAPFSLKDLVQKSYERLHHLSEDKRVQLSIHVPSDLIVVTDLLLTERGLDNVISNAIKFSPEGGVIEIKAAAQNDRIELNIIDQGPGVPAALREEIFGDYTSFDTGATTHGLGLSFTRLVMNKIGGSIRVVEHGNSGANFLLDFPRAATRNKISLSPELLIYRDDICKQLAHIPIYDISNIKTVLAELATEPSELKAWKQRVLELAYAGNEEVYRAEIGVVEP